jgi:hypothetical protein
MSEPLCPSDGTLSAAKGAMNSALLLHLTDVLCKVALSALIVELFWGVPDPFPRRPKLFSSFVNLRHHEELRCCVMLGRLLLGYECTPARVAVLCDRWSFSTSDREEQKQLATAYTVVTAYWKRNSCSACGPWAHFSVLVTGNSLRLGFSP